MERFLDVRRTGRALAQVDVARDDGALGSRSGCHQGQCKEKCFHDPKLGTGREAGYDALCRTFMLIQSALGFILVQYLGNPVVDLYRPGPPTSSAASVSNTAAPAGPGADLRRSRNRRRARG